MKVKVKKLDPNAVIPTYAHPNEDAGLDLTAVRIAYNKQYDYYEYHTGLAFEIPKGYVGLVYPRSSNRKTDCYMPNSVGVIDSGFRNEVLVTFKDKDMAHAIQPPYNVGDRIAQIIIMPYPQIELEEADELSESNRGKGGHGSTGV